MAQPPLALTFEAWKVLVKDAFARGDELELHRLFDRTAPLYHAGMALPSLAEIEAKYTARVLDHHGGNKAAASRTLGIDRRTLYRHLEKAAR